MTDAPEAVRKMACSTDAEKIASMLHRYADLLERLAKPMNNNDVCRAVAIIFPIPIAHPSDYERIRAALDAYRKSLPGETK